MDRAAYVDCDTNHHTWVEFFPASAFHCVAFSGGAGRLELEGRNILNSEINKVNPIRRNQWC